MLKNKLNTIFLRLKKSVYLKNIATLASGTIIALFIPLLMAPILSRIYLPEDYGLLGVFMSITSLTGILAVLQLSQAVIISESDEERMQIISSAMRINLFVAFLVLILVFFLNDFIITFFKSPGLKYLLYLAPVQIILAGFSTLFMSSLNKTKQYKKMSMVRIIIAVSVVSMSLTFGLLGYHKGLIYSLVLGNIIGTGVLAKLYFSYKTQTHNFNYSIFKKTLKKHKKFPLFSAPTGFLGTLTNQLPVFILSRLANLSVVGSFNYSRRMLGLPSSFLSQSITEVFRQQASDDYQKLGNAKAIFSKTLKLLLLMSILPFSVIFIWGPEIFTFVFGNNWTEAGEFSRILSLMFFFRFTVSPLSYMYIIAGHQKEDLIMHIFILIFTGGSMILGYIVFSSFPAMFIGFSVSYSLIYIIYLIRSYQFANGSTRKN
ncbi:MAG: oligosaccharide flippase family protein [Bacteroidales bacterium]|nr:oligosaccharide flippase family protein [Bacteroidales bacterium]